MQKCAIGKMTPTGLSWHGTNGPTDRTIRQDLPSHGTACRDLTHHGKHEEGVVFDVVCCRGTASRPKRAKLPYRVGGGILSCCPARSPLLRSQAFRA